MFLICILLGSSVESFAHRGNIENTLTFEELQKLIKSHQICEILYNPSKLAAMVNIDCGSAYYINFITKQTHRIVDQWPSVFFSWRNDKIAEVVSSCGTGCTQAVIFIAPSTVIACNSHDFRVKGMEKNEPNLSSNRPLLIDIKKNVYVCYDANDNIQVYTFPKSPTIYTPYQHFVEAAKINNNHLVIRYENEQTGQLKELEYPL
jgi:hypothetical protein